MKDKSNNIAWRVGQLEKCTEEIEKKNEFRYEKLDGKVDTILTNHLPHINENMISLKTRMNILTAINLGAIILGIIVAKILS